VAVGRHAVGQALRATLPYLSRRRRLRSGCHTPVDHHNSLGAAQVGRRVVAERLRDARVRGADRPSHGLRSVVAYPARVHQSAQVHRHSHDARGHVPRQKILQELNEIRRHDYDVSNSVLVYFSCNIRMICFGLNNMLMLLSLISQQIIASFHPKHL